MSDWTPDLTRSDRPRYLAIADAIAEDVRSGRLAPAARLPPQRALARRSTLILPRWHAAMWRPRSAA